MNVVKTVILGNRCVRVTCTQSPKIATFEGIQIYGSAKTRETDYVARARVYSLLCETVYVVGKLIHC